MSKMEGREVTELEALAHRMKRNGRKHIKEALRLQAANDLATYGVAIGGGAIMALAAGLALNNRPPELIEFCILLLSSALTLLGIWQAVWKPGERALRHRMWSAQFSALEADCKAAAKNQNLKAFQELTQRALILCSVTDLIPERFWRPDDRFNTNGENQQGGTSKPVR